VYLEREGVWMYDGEGERKEEIGETISLWLLWRKRYVFKIKPNTGFLVSVNISIDSLLRRIKILYIYIYIYVHMYLIGDPFFDLKYLHCFMYCIVCTAIIHATSHSEPVDCVTLFSGAVPGLPPSMERVLSSLI
jgi:hypothetical protein